MESLVLTVIGPDRPGLVESLASAIAAHDASWEESSMAQLAGEFCGILRVAVDPSRVDALVADLEKLSETGLSVVAKRGRVDADASDPARRLIHLQLIGTDRPGIVRDISSALANHGVNVEELSTEVGDAPWSGETVFRATARLRIPSALILTDLQEAMEQIAHDMMVDIELKEEAGED